jgi:hypothetical protein
MTKTPETLHQALDRLYRDDAPKIPPYRVWLNGAWYRYAPLWQYKRIVYIARETETGIEWLYRINLDADKYSEPSYIPAVVAANVEDAHAHFALVTAVLGARVEGTVRRILGDVYAPLV